MFDRTPTPGKLLVVDDNRMNRLLLAKGLEQQGHQVASAENGREAIEMMRAESFDLLLLDIEMPEMNGFQVLEVMNADPSLRQVPVLVVSASDEMDSVVKCIEMGAEDYLVKPPNPVLLRARVNASLEKKHLRDMQRRLFRTFTNNQVADELLARGFSLGGKHVRASAMFCDVRNFTSIAESRDPGETIELLNDLFAMTFSAVSDHCGIINHIQGDGVMAIFGAAISQPEHATLAVQAAVEVNRRLAVFNAESQKRNKPYPEIAIGIGVATGTVVAGYVGTQERATYTCIGDTVNLAARIEDHTKTVQKVILVDEFTKDELVPGEFRLTPLGEQVFKGKTRPIKIYAVE